jgi:molybdenum cofactor cytidylyltransferase
VQPEVVERILERWRATQAQAVAPFHQGQRGHPFLFDRSAWPTLMALPADANPRQALPALGPLERVEVDTDSILRDVDTPAEYAREIASRAS